MRTIYRRTLLIAPWVNPYRYTDANGVVDDTFTFDGGRLYREARIGADSAKQRRSR